MNYRYYTKKRKEAKGIPPAGGTESGARYKNREAKAEGEFRLEQMRCYEKKYQGTYIYLRH